MARVHLRIETEFVCGAIAVGTVDHVRVLQRELGLGLGAAKALVDRCVFNGEIVVVEVPSETAANAVARALESLPGPARTTVRVEP